MKKIISLILVLFTALFLSTFKVNALPSYNSSFLSTTVGVNLRLAYNSVGKATPIIAPSIGYSRDPYGTSLAASDTRTLFRYYIYDGESEYRAFCMDATWAAKNTTYYLVGRLSKSEYLEAYKVYNYTLSNSGGYSGSSDSYDNALLAQLSMWMIFDNPVKNINSSVATLYNGDSLVTPWIEYKTSEYIDKLFDRTRSDKLFVAYSRASYTKITNLEGSKILKDDHTYASYKDVARYLMGTKSISSEDFVKYTTYDKLKNLYINDKDTYREAFEIIDAYRETIIDYFNISAYQAAFTTVTNWKGVLEMLRDAGAAIRSDSVFYDGFSADATEFYDNFQATTAYSGDLCVYQARDVVANQEFLAPCIISDHIVDPDDPTDPTDPEEPDDKLYGKIKTEEIDADCSSQTTGYQYEWYDEFEEVETKTDLESGTEEQQLGDYAALYCKESHRLELPSSVNSSITLGSYLIWPTSASTLTSIYGNNYSLYLVGQKECKIEVAYGDNEYHTYINQKDILSDLKTKTNAITGGNTTYEGTTYEAYRVNSLLGKDCNAGVFTDSCSAKLAPAMGYLSSVGISSISEYNTINNLYNTWSSASSATGSQACSDAQAFADMYAANCADPEISASNPGWCRDKDAAASQAAAACSSVSTTSPKDEAYNNYAAATTKSTSEWTTIVSNVSSYLTEYNACIASLNSCNAYASTVTAAIDIVNSVVKYGNYTFSGTALYSNWDTSLDISWNDEEYGATINDSNLEKVTTATCTDCYGLGIAEMSYKTLDGNIQTDGEIILNSAIPQIKARNITANFTTSYSLPSDNSLYNYVNKTDGKAVSDIGSISSDNYTTIGYSNLPISFDAKIGTKYKLSITNIQYGSDLKYSNPDYVCDYEVTQTPTNECVCPTGTEHEGEDLYCLIRDTSDTCATAQAQYCNDTDIEETVFSCTKDKYCSSNPEIKLTACINGGKTYSECEAALCGSTTYRCENQNDDGGYMDITSCVQTKTTQGYTLDDAKILCNSLVCSLSGIEIIYRTINLANPFPGKDISKTVSGFNVDVIGRYPGINWNSKVLVEEEILENRSVTNEEVYQEEPLYTFELTPEIINNIREYNADQMSNGGYADYTLDCKSENSSACVSDFVHDSDYGIVSGTCSGNLSVGNFYECMK